MASQSLLTAQHDCDTAVPGYAPDGTPKTKLYNVGGGLRRIHPAKAAGRFTSTRSTAIGLSPGLVIGSHTRGPIGKAVLVGWIPCACR
jgi:hypothetical protein